jgi:hypothetical protein
MLMATFGLACKKRKRAAGRRMWGAATNVGMSSRPFQWNQLGTIRGVPSRATYATRAGNAEASSARATSVSSRLRSPCASAIRSPWSAASVDADARQQRDLRFGLEEQVAVLGRLDAICARHEARVETVTDAAERFEADYDWWCAHREIAAPHSSLYSETCRALRSSIAATNASVSSRDGYGPRWISIS